MSKSVVKNKAIKKVSSEYNEEDIQHFEGLQAVRKRPTMYMGMLGEEGTRHLFREIIDNGLDEFRSRDSKGNPYATEIFVSIDEVEKRVTVVDNGRGIPLGKLEGLITKLHMGGKFDSDAYEYSIGMNGVGLKVTNALSKDFFVQVKRDGKQVETRYSKGELIEPIKEVKKTKETGTYVSFVPDETVMKKHEIDHTYFMKFCEETSYLNKGLVIKFHATTKDGKEVNKTFCSKNGLIDLVNSMDKNLAVDPITLHLTDDKLKADIVIAYSKKVEEERIISFCNGVNTHEGGTHEAGAKGGLTKVINAYIDKAKLKTKKDENLKIEGEDCREGIIMIIDTKHPEPEYDSQTKSKIGNTDLQGLTNKIMLNQFAEFLVKNKDIAKVICQKAIIAAKGREAAKRSKAAVTKSKSNNPFENISSLSKFTDCNSDDPSKRILFIVEGDSAGGSAIAGRDPEIHAIYKLKGKPLNTFEKSVGRIWSNKEIRDLFNIIGCGVGDAFDPKKARFHKIVYLTDADIDGFDIRCQLDGLFYKHMRQLIELGYVYHAEAPLYHIKEGKQEIYIRDKEKYNEYLNNKIKNKYQLIVKKPTGLEKVDTLKVMSKARHYSLKLNTTASEFGIPTTLLEELALNLKSLKETTQRLGLNYNETKHGDFIEGLYGETYVTILVTDTNLRKLRFVTQFYAELGLTKVLAYKEKTGKKTIVSTLGDFIEVAMAYAKPKYLKRIKGLGEMDPDELFETTMNLNNPNVKLIQLTVTDEESTETEFKIQLGDNADKRKISMDNFEIDPLDLDK